MPKSLKETMFCELELDTDNLNGDYFRQRSRDTVWEEIVLNRFDYADIDWYLKDEDIANIMKYLTKQMSTDDWKTCFEKFGDNPKLSDIMECSLMKIFNEIFDILYPVVMDNLENK